MIKTKTKKQLQKEMMRSLQGLFCNRRYQSWVSYQESILEKQLEKSKKGGNNEEKRYILI
jgi:hypothetical protein